MIGYIFSHIKSFLVYIWESELMSLFRMQPELWMAGLNRRKCVKCPKSTTVDSFRKKSSDTAQNKGDDGR